MKELSEDFMKNFNVTSDEKLEENVKSQEETNEVDESNQSLQPEQSEKFKAILQRIYNCYPKKKYTNEYRKKRQKKNKMAKKSRQNNRR